jgi:hypothetical protein
MGIGLGFLVAFIVAFCVFFLLARIVTTTKPGHSCDLCTGDAIHKCLDCRSYWICHDCWRVNLRRCNSCHEKYMDEQWPLPKIPPSSKAS